MTEATKLFNLICVIFILLLALASSFGGVIGELIRYLAFLIPTVIGFYYSKDLQIKREEVKGVAEAPDTLLDFDRKRVKLLLPIIAPVILVVFLTSLLTSFVLSLFGIVSAPVEDAGIVKMLLLHALIPAVLEEALFRYIPLKLMRPYSKKWCILYSSFCFALIHCSFGQMPYAFVAGFAFMLVDIVFGSVWPSVILHLLNNATSVVFMKYASGVGAATVFVGALVALALVSFVFIFKKRGEYRSMLRGAFETGERHDAINLPIILMVVCFYLAWTAL